MSKHRLAWLTPETIPAGTTCRVLIVPDAIEWRGMVNGALALLTDAENFEEFGALTADEVAERFAEMYDSYLDEECVVLVANDLIVVQEQQTSGTHGGTFNSGADRTRTLNAEITDTGSHASLSANQITLQPGTYRGRAWAVAWFCGTHRLKFHNVTDNITYVGSSEYLPQANQHNGQATVSFSFTITSAKVFELRHRCSASAGTAGFGFASGLGTEVYAEVTIERMPD